MAVLRAQATDVAEGEVSWGRVSRRVRDLSLVGAALSIVLVFVPPLWTESSRYEFAAAIQFSLAAFAFPAFLVVGWPAARLRGTRVGEPLWRWCARLGAGRTRQPSLWRSLLFVGLDVGLIVFWRTPGMVDALGRQRWLVVAEFASLAVAGVALWLEMVRCPPLAPRTALPRRGVLAALVMWGTWITAYAEGFAQESWYRSFHGGSLTGLSGQEIATAVVFLAAFCTFMPLIYFEVVEWLNRGEADPDEELRRLVREAHRRGQA